MYNFRYDFWTEDFFPNFKSSVDELYKKSLNEYIDAVVNDYIKTSSDVGDDLRYFDEFFRDFEYYYVSIIKLGIVNKRNFNNILNGLSTIKLIKTFESKDMDVSAVTCDGEIYINSKTKNKLSDMEDFAFNQMIFSHELGHIICGTWEKDIWGFVNKLYNGNKKVLKELKLNNKNYLSDGLFLLEEAIVQNCAEDVTYRLLNKKRGKVRPIINNDVFPDEVIHSNFNFYEELQEIAVKFAKCLNFLNCGDKKSYDLILDKLAQKAFCRDFILQLAEDICTSSERIEDFTIMLACMGKIKEAIYAKMVYGKKPNTGEIEEYLDIFNFIAENNTCVNSIKNKEKINA